MARWPRLAVSGVPMHITQRGNNRIATFSDVADFAQYRSFLHHASAFEGCAIHAYALMTNHVHLLVTPLTTSGASRMMQALGRQYVRYFNARQHRTGTLWEGRFKSALVDSEHYALACYRYIELNPVRAGIVTSPWEYRWSGHARNAHGTHEPRITPHAAYLSLGADDATRLDAYRRLFTEIDTHDIDALRLHTQQQKPWGNERFRRQIEALAQRSVEVRPRGRPRSNEGK